MFSHLWAGHQVSLGVSVCAVHQVLCSLIFGLFLQILQTLQTEMGAKRVTYVISTYQHWLTAMLFVPGTSYGRQWCCKYALLGLSLQ